MAFKPTRDIRRAPAALPSVTQELMAPEAFKRSEQVRAPYRTNQEPSAGSCLRPDYLEPSVGD